MFISQILKGRVKLDCVDQRSEEVKNTDRYRHDRQAPPTPLRHKYNNKMHREQRQKNRDKKTARHEVSVLAGSRRQKRHVSGTMTEEAVLWQTHTLNLLNGTVCFAIVGFFSV